jgi:hypothetical protein
MLAKQFSWSVLIIIILLSPSVLAIDELEKKLHEVDKLRAGFSTPFDEVENRCNELLQRYLSPKDQGRIYYMLAHVEGQSGLQRPKKTLGYIDKALELTQDTLKRAQLYMYQGNSIEVMNRGVHGKSLMAPRELAARSYLDGIQECYERISALEAMPKEVDTQDVDIQKMGRANNKLLTQAKYAQDMRDREIENLMGFQDAYIEQVSYLYSRFPFDTKNLEKLVKDTIKDETLIEKLMTKVRMRVQDRAHKMQDEVVDGQLVELNDGLTKSINTLGLPKQTSPAASADKKNIENLPQEILLNETEQSGLSVSAIAGLIIMGIGVLIVIIIWFRKTKGSMQNR